MAEQQSRSMTRAEWTMLFTLSTLWGSSFFFLKVLVEQIPPFTVVLGRVGLAAIFLNLFLLVRRDPMTAKLPWGQFIVMGILNNVILFSLIVWGETRVSSGLASILNATTPVFTVVAAHFLTRTERLTWARAIGVLFGILDVIVLVVPDLPSLHVATGQITGATLVMLPIAAITERFWALPPPTATVWGAFAGIALICTVLAYVLYFRILTTAGATNLLLVTFLLPISALLLGSMVLGEHIQLTAYLGMALIGAALAAIDGRVIAAIRPRPATT